MLQPGTTIQYIAPYEDWGAHGTVTGVLDSEKYTVDLLPPRTGTAVWGRNHVTRVWDGADVVDAVPHAHPGGTLPIPGLRPTLRVRCPLPRSVVGSFNEAQTVADWRPECSPYDDPKGWEPVGEGAHRAVILNPARTTVYKVETEAGRNRREHRTLRGLRDQGFAHAPPTTLWTMPRPYGTGADIEVLAMPYLPNDGTAPRAPYPRAGVVDLNPTNITVCHHRYWLIDASGL
ncbi:hypothetical protein JJV70_16040 [Streptomyces sp. JJ66]|uniref:hypothetical protein n=1 Tax=Streptomyces sp. JJ66 TaxID=2803843 RepID=UPI001C55E988|nr:hypothetical protein [Streptomyces sp. JJ66]MBW1603587.1 hypothetical protein [Streptomyces sp. JJ66]